MADAPSKDPSALWRDLVSQWEKNVNALANQTMASDEFSSTSNQAMSLALKMQQATGTAMATYLATMNLPSRADVTALGDRLQAIETYLARIAAALETAPGTSGGRGRRSAPIAAKPPRTKKPPSLVEP
jgi:hypothetical protein